MDVVNRSTAVMLILVGLVAGVVVWVAGVPVWVVIPVALVFGGTTVMHDRNVDKENPPRCPKHECRLERVQYDAVGHRFYMWVCPNPRCLTIRTR